MFLNYAGAAGTYATGISGDNVVGYYTTSGGQAFGFLYNTSTSVYTQMNLPGSTDTQVNGV